MFAQSKKFIIPLVAVLVACMTVEATTSPDLPLPIVCNCSILVPSSTSLNETQQACEAVGQANGAVWNATTDLCQIVNEAAYHNYKDIVCPSFTAPDPSLPGSVVTGYANCAHDVPVPQSCVCADASGVNTTAQTQKSCTIIGNIGTMIGDKCQVSNQFAYSAFGSICSGKYPGSKAICSV